MAIFLTGESRIMIQGITGSEGTKHGRRMLAAGTTVVGGTNPRKAGQTVDLGDTAVPVFGTVADTMAATGADVSVVFVPPAGAKSAVIEAIDAQIPLCIVITEGIPVHDSTEFWAYANAKGNVTRIVGPNCPGVASPGKSNAGIIPADITSEGRIGLVSKSGTLTYQMMYELRDIGFSTAVGIGGDPVIGTTHIDCLRAFAGRPGNRRDRDDRRDRRGRGGTGRRLYRAERRQAGGRLRGGVHRARGQDDGPRRGHRVGVVGHRTGQEGSPGEGRGPGGPHAQRDGAACPRGRARPLNTG